MSLSILLTAILVLSRLGGAIMVMPGFAAMGMPRLVRMAIAIALTVLVVPSVPPTSIESDLVVLVASVMSEVTLGVLMGGSVAMVFGGLVFATEIMGSQTGRMMAQQFNPLLKMSQGPIGILAGMMATLVFFGLNLHLAVLFILSESFHDVRPGSAIAVMDVAAIWVGMAAPVLKAGLGLAGPVLALVFLVNCFVAVLAKLAPSMNVFFSIGFILTMIAGMGLVYVTLPHLIEAHMAMVIETVDALPEMVRAAGGK